MVRTARSFPYIYIYIFIYDHTSSNCACSRITRFFLSERISNFNMLPACLPVCTCAYIRECVAPYSRNHGQSRDDALRCRREREREYRACETPEHREARLYQHRLHDGERIYSLRNLASERMLVYSLPARFDT